MNNYLEKRNENCEYVLSPDINNHSSNHNNDLYSNVNMSNKRNSLKDLFSVEKIKNIKSSITKENVHSVFKNKCPKYVSTELPCRKLNSKNKK